MICPIINSGYMAQKSDTEPHQFLEKCREKECAWWIEYYEKNGECVSRCGITVIGKVLAEVWILVRW